MRKNYLLFYCVLLSTILSAQNTLQGKVFYTVSLKQHTEYEVDSIVSKRKTSKKTKEFLRKMLLNTKDVICVLSFVNNESLYGVEDKLKHEIKAINITFLAAGGSNLYYINTKEKDYFKQINIEEPIRVSLPLIKWNITQETKQIGNYTCFKAIGIREPKNSNTSKEIVAWFAPSIPVNFGPNEYFGLPGLILEVSCIKNLSIKATKIILNPQEKINVKKPTKGKRMTEEQYIEMNREFFKNLEK